MLSAFSSRHRIEDVNKKLRVNDRPLLLIKIVAMEIVSFASVLGKRRLVVVANVGPNWNFFDERSVTGESGSKGELVQAEIRFGDAASFTLETLIKF